MKKQLLITGTLFLALGAYAQTGQVKPKPNGIINQAEKLAAKFASANSPLENGPSAGKAILPANPGISPNHSSTESASSSPIIAAPWTRISGSFNILGMIVSASKPLQYNRYIDAVSFIQRRSTTYSMSPTMNANAASGPIVAMLGKDCGNIWDSTLLYADQTNWSRYPQGGLYSPMGNHNYDAAYAVAMGPVTATGGGWIGSYYASKSMTPTIQKNAAGPDQQFMSHTAPFGSATSPAMPKHYFPRYGFSQCDNGMVYSLGGLYDEYGVVTAGQPEKFRGAMLAKGNFVSGSMVWTADSFIPPVVVTSANARQLFSQPYMAWDDNGTVGYVVFIGGRTGSTGSNFGWQPIVYKTTTGGTSWSLVNGINFNTPTVWDFVLNSMSPVNTNSNLAIPFFNVGEGIDCAVDKNGKLHIGSTVVGTARNHADSMGYTWQFPKGTENMSWFYANTAWPYIFDFIGDGTNAWTFKTIDSVGSEGPAATSGQPGFSSNPWANQGQTTPQASDMRLQLSRTYDGEFILFSYAESDTTITTGATKWNEFPNIKMKALRICDNVVSNDRYSVSSPSTGFNPRVRDKAYFHYMSRQSRGGMSTLTAAQFTVPLSVTNNVACNGDNPTDTYFGRVVVSYAFPSGACGSTVTTGVNNVTSNETTRSRIYPNPAKNSFNVEITLASVKDINIDLYNAIGQKVSAIKVNGQAGENTVKMDVENVNPGVYFVKIRSGNTESTKKLIIE
jgi:hypothetical protein